MASSGANCTNDPLLCHTTGRPALANCPDSGVVSVYLYAVSFALPVYQSSRQWRHTYLAFRAGVNFAAVNVSSVASEICVTFSLSTPRILG